MDPLEERLKGLREPLVLDVATGGGGFAAHLREQYPGLGGITGIDISIKGLKSAGNGPGGVERMYPVCMDSSLMAFRDRTFGLVCISNSLHHMESVERTLREMVRVLRPGGTLLVSEMYRDGLTETQTSHLMMHEWWAEIDRRRGVPHYSTFTRGDILSLIEGLGLKDVITRDHSFTDGDPMEEGLIQRLCASIDSYLEKLGGPDENTDLRQRGERLRERLLNTGFHSASSLAVIGTRP